MKKSLAVGALLSALFVPIALAAEMQIHTISGTEIMMQLPASNYIITPETLLNDPVFDFLALDDPQAALDQNTASGVLLDSVDPELTYEIVVTSPAFDYAATGCYDLREISDEVLAEAITALSEVFASQEGISVLDSETYMSPQALYIVIDYTLTQDDIFSYSREYYTVCNQNILTIALHNISSSPISVEQSSLFTEIVDSITYPSMPIHSASSNDGVVPFNTPSSSTPPHTNLLLKFIGGAISGLFLGGMAMLIHRFRNPKKRTISSAPPVAPAAPRPRPSKTLPPPVRFSPIDLVPRRLSGITDQAERDRIVADIFRGNSDPYTQNPITCEADWNAYVAAYYADKDEAARKRSETLHNITQQQPKPPQQASQPPSLAHVPPEQRYRPCADCGANIPYPEYETETLCRACRAKQEALRLVSEPDEADSPETAPEPQIENPRPLYCRLCGAKLHDDSLFCEFCGEPIPTDNES